MARFRLGLANNTDDRNPSRLQVVYEYSDGRPRSEWWVDPIGSVTHTATIIVDCAGNLSNGQNVKSRTLILHYTTQPITVHNQIVSVLAAASETAVGELAEGRDQDQQETPPKQSHTGSQHLSRSHQLHIRQISEVKENTMSTPYQITINMKQDTVTSLSHQGFNLYGFKAVKTPLRGGAPVVWFQTSTFGLQTDVNWTEQYQAYTTNSQAITNGLVTATNAYNIGLDQTLDVTDPTGTGSVDTMTGTPSAISILNKTTTPFTCGISQLQGSVATPICAFPLNGKMLDVIAPIEQVVLMFATNQLDTGAVIYQAFSSGVFLDLTSEHSLSVKFDINNGWDWGGGPEGRLIEAQANLLPFLIQQASQSSALARSMLTGRSRPPAGTRL